MTMTIDKPAHEQLTPEVLVAWRKVMGFTQRQAADALGCARASIVNWETAHNPIPPYIGLAMSALACGMTHYGAPEKSDEEGE